MGEVDRLDSVLAGELDAEARANIWQSVESILSHGPTMGGTNATTVLALGYVQSGKTTSITALSAAAADAGYQLVIALLGSTNLLLEQNQERLEGYLGITSRDDWVWATETNPSTEAAGKKLRRFIEMGRVCMVPVLKHAGRIRSVAKQLEKIPDEVSVLIIDDEADQASLNTSNDAESRTYSAIRQLRESVPRHLYVQYTATPYAPLLLDAADILSPQHVEFLVPGKGYTGGRQFFIDDAERVVRTVPMLDEQASKSPPLALQKSLSQALSSFLAGAALLLARDEVSTPISMLVHSTARNDVQARYEFLIRRQIDKWKHEIDPTTIESVPEIILEERKRLVGNGAEEIDDTVFVSKLNVAVSEAWTWLVNSAADINKIDWYVSPVHILIGGNKLDRGFTVKGLTVTYMNRPASPQVDTLEQRARAFGYRRDQLPYCQFFASKKTIRSLTEIVHTEDDLRARLRDHVEDGGSVHTWAREIGLLLPSGMAPTRSTVVKALSRMSLGWHQMRMPSLLESDNLHNESILKEIGLLGAPFVSQGRLAFRTLELRSRTDLDALLSNWRIPHYSPGWMNSDFVESALRGLDLYSSITVMLMEDNGSFRTRKWTDESGFINLFQGRDLKPQDNGEFYPGDRKVNLVDSEPDQVIIQVHRVRPRGRDHLGDVFAMAAYLGPGNIVRKVNND